jgi:DNA-binding NarL/FixJ family response regulator
MRVLLVDDHPVILEVLRAVVTRAFAPSTIYAVKDFDSALKRARSLTPRDLVVLDLSLPGYSGIEALSRFRSSFPRLPVVVVSAIEDRAVIRAAIAAGARGYIPKTSSVSLMQSALEVAAAGGVFLPPAALANNSPEGRSRSASTLDRPRLSERQIEVLRRIAKGLHNRQIAVELEISENTVKRHAHEVFRTLGVSTRTEALVAAMRYGLRID